MLLSDRGNDVIALLPAARDLGERENGRRSYGKAVSGFNKRIQNFCNASRPAAFFVTTARSSAFNDLLQPKTRLQPRINVVQTNGGIYATHYDLVFVYHTGLVHRVPSLKF
jgi:hypothetical protein